MSVPTIRDARPGDTETMRGIYAPYVRDTAISFELEPPSPQAFRERVTEGQKTHPWLVAVRDDLVIAYAYANPHRARAAYRYSVETSIYVAPDRRRDGVGRALYRALLDQLPRLGYCNAYAGVTLPNPASEHFHRAMGFQPIGVFPSVGYKFDRWHDLSWWHRPLRDQPLDEPKVR